MFEALVRGAIQHRVAVVVAAMVVIVGGWIAGGHMPISVYPEIHDPTVIVMADAHGLAPEEVETSVIIHLEHELDNLPGIKEVRSTSGTGFGVIYAQFVWGTEIEWARQQVADAIGLAIPHLPADIPTPTLMPVTAHLGEILECVVEDTSGTLDLAQVRRLVDNTVAPRIESVDGVAHVVRAGGLIVEAQVNVDPDLLDAAGVDLESVLHALETSNHNSSGGVYVQSHSEYVIRGIGAIDGLEDVRNTLVGNTRDGEPVFVGDIAVVKLAPAERRGLASFGGHEVVVCRVAKKPESNTLQITDDVLKTLDELSLPDGVVVHPVFAQADLIDRSVATVRGAVIDGAFLVVVILALFLGNIRTSVITLASIPLSILAAAWLMSLMGHSVNIMTLGGIAIAVGMVVDDAIIVVENTNRRLGDKTPAGGSVDQVTTDATLEIFQAIFWATVIIVLAFIPLLRLTDISGELFHPLGLTVIVAMLCSLGVSVLVAPALCRMLLVRSGDVVSVGVGRVQTWVKEGYRPMVVWSLRHRRGVAGASMGGIAIMAALISYDTLVRSLVGKEFLPTMDEGTLVLHAVVYPGASLDESSDVVGRIEKALLPLPYVTGVTSLVGRVEEDEHAAGSYSSVVLVIILPPEERTQGRKTIMEEVRLILQKFPGVALAVGQPIEHRISHLRSGIRAQLAIKIFGTDLGRLHRLAQEVRGAISGIDGVVDLQIEPQVSIPQYVVDIDRRASGMVGLTPGVVTEFVDAALQGESLGQINHEGATYTLRVRLKESARGNLGLMKQIPVMTPKGYSVPLSSIANVRMSEGPNTVHREEGRRRTVIQLNIAGRDLASVVHEVQVVMGDQIVLPAGYNVSYAGQFEDQQQAMGQLIVNGALIVAAMFAILFWVFDSAALSAVVLMNLPLAALGGLVGVWASGGRISVSSAIGFLLLFGIAIRNGIVLISHIKALGRDGLALRDAIVKGAETRVIPVLMTAITTGLGMLPLALASGSGAELQRPLAWVIIGGMMTSTVLTMIVLPALFELVVARETQE